MSSYNTSGDPRINSLKREAWKRKKATPGLTQAVALDQVAKEQGFANWSRLVQQTHKEQK